MAPKRLGNKGIIPLLGFILGLLCAGPGYASSQAGGLQVGTRAPLFCMRDISGTDVDLSALISKSRAVIINFWGLRCGDCLLEMPSLNAIYRKYKAAGVLILGVNVDGIGTDIIKSQLQRLQEIPAYTIIPDEELKVTDLYKMTGAPLTLVVDSAGVIVYVHEGYRPGDEAKLGDIIDRLLR